LSTQNAQTLLLTLLNLPGLRGGMISSPPKGNRYRTYRISHGAER